MVQVFRVANPLLTPHSLSPFFWEGFFLGSHLQHMEVPRLGAELELQPPAYTTVTAMWDLHHSSQQHHILNPLVEARVLMVPYH